MMRNDLKSYFCSPEAAVNAIAEEVASNTISTAGEAVSAIGGLFDIQPSDYDANEADYLYQQSQEKKRKKKRGKGFGFRNS